MSVKKPLWQYPWKYRESFIIAFSLLMAGFVIEFFTRNKSILLPSWPVNLYIILAFWGYIIFVSRYVKNRFVRWLSSQFAAISAISVLTFLILLMGFISQDDKEASSFTRSIGLSHVNHSWTYIMCSLYLMIILGFTIIRRLLPVNIKNIAFFLNHAGLWLVIATASLGSADLWKLTMVLKVGEEINTAVDSKRTVYEMPLKLKLLNFQIEEFSPELGIISNKEVALITKKGDKLLEAREGNKGKLAEWDVFVEKFYDSAIKDSSGYVYADKIGSTNAAYINIVNSKTGFKKSGWVTKGSIAMSREFLKLDSKHSVVMTMNQPKKFSSKIQVQYLSGEKKEVNIEVNKPIRINNWKMYQTGYNEKMGKWSNVSIVELVRDPWIPVVYTGIFMILAGSLYLVFVHNVRFLRYARI